MEKEELIIVDDFNEEEIEKNFLKKYDNGILLSDNHIAILERYDIDYKKFASINELLYEIDECLNDGLYDDADDLEWVSIDIAERNYYQNTNK